MDLRAILNKLDKISLNEALSLDDIANAVKGKEKDEQARAEILNDLAWQHKLPGLYDPISGYFVGKQSVSSGMDGQQRISIAATGSERSDRALADLGLIPDNAKTSTGLGRMFRGDDKGQYDQDIRSRSQGVVSKQKYEKFKSENLPKLKDLASQLKTAIEKMKTSDSSSSSPGGFFGLDPSKIKFGPGLKITESLLKEFEDEIIEDDTINEESSAEIKKIVDQINNIILQFDSMADQVKQDPETQREIESVKSEIVAAIKAIEDKARADREKADREKADREKADAERQSATTTNTDQNKQPGSSTDKKEPGAPTTTTSSGSSEIKKVQEMLIGLGIALPKYGADGKMGSETIEAIKQFEKMAGMPETGKITPELIKALENGKDLIARSQLIQAITSVEKIMAKYKITEDVDQMSVKELKKFVLENINQFSPSDQISILQLTMLSEDEILKEASPFPTAEPLPSVVRLDGKTWEQVPGVPDRYRNRANPAEQLSASELDNRIKGRPTPPGPTPPGPTPEPKKRTAWDKLKTFGKRVIRKVGRKIPLVLAGIGLAAGVDTLYKWLTSEDVAMDPADKAELLKNLEIIQKYAKDEKAVAALPYDVKNRLANILKNAEKLANMETAQPAATPK